MVKLLSKKQYKYHVADDIFLQFSNYYFNFFDKWYQHWVFHSKLFAFLSVGVGKFEEKIIILNLFGK